MIWKLVARIKVPNGRVTSLTSNKPTREKFEFFTIALGPRRQLRCTCGRIWTMKPTEYELPANVDMCNHIKALYGGGDAANPLAELLRDVAPRIPIGRVYLTPLGEELFHHRWAANALK